jgi:hypothetical protein
VIPPSPSWPTLVAILLGLAIFAGLLVAGPELIRLLRGSRVEQMLRKRRERKAFSLFSPGRFPVVLVALTVLCVLVFSFAFYAWMVLQAPATLGFTASFDRANPAVMGTNTAAPTVGMTIPAYVTLKAPGEHLSDAAVVVTGPPTVALSDCYAHAQGQKPRGYARGSQARIPLGDLGPSEEVEVQCNISVVHRIRRLETVEFEMTAANWSDSPRYFLYLVPPDVKQGQETAEAQADEEIRTSPALWQKSSMVAAKGGFEELGERWPLVDPRYLHGFRSEPRGRTTTLRHLQSTRVEPSKIITLNAVISSDPVTQERFEAKGSERQAIRQVFAVGQQPGEKGGWCTTTRSTAQAPLKEGRHVKLRAAVVEWGISEASGGIAVMLNCPAVKVLGAIGGAARAFDSGGATVPDRLNR